MYSWRIKKVNQLFKKKINYNVIQNNHVNETVKNVKIKIIKKSSYQNQKKVK